MTGLVAAEWLCCVSSNTDSAQVRHVPCEQEVLGKLCKHELHSLYVQCKSIQQLHLAELPSILLSNVGDGVEARTASQICFFYLAIEVQKNYCTSSAVN